MTDNIDWKALFGLYMDHVDAQEGTDFLWPDFRPPFAASLGMTPEQRAEFDAFVEARHAAQDAKHAAFKARIDEYRAKCRQRAP